jgi:hypothetical protein
MKQKIIQTIHLPAALVWGSDLPFTLIAQAGSVARVVTP